MSDRCLERARGASWPAISGGAGARNRAVSRGVRRSSAARVGAALVGVGLVLPAPAGARERTNAELPAAYRRSPFALMSLSVGAPTNGWQIRAKKLKPSENLWIQDKSVPYSYGHPALVLMLHRTAKQMARQTPRSVLLVGDLSREYGGPLAGHRSHQSGRDADVGFFVTDEKGNPLNSRKLRTFDSQGRARDGSGLRFDDYRNWLLVQLWLKDSRADLEYVFVASHLRRRLLEFAQKRPAFSRYVDDAAQFLRQPSNGLPHDDHFHIRIACPDKQRGLCDPVVVRR
jgi:penicillin-insensitive murein DD-endopeptidase